MIQDVPVGRGPPPASGGGCAEEGDRPSSLKLDVKTVQPGHRPADAAGAGVAAAAQHPGRRGGSRSSSGCAQEPAVDRQTDSPVAAAVGGTGRPADGAPVRGGAAGEDDTEGGLRAPQRASRHDDGGRLRGIVGRRRRCALQGQVPGGDAAVQQHVLRQGVPGRAALDAFHVLPLLERKHRAVSEATALADWRLAPVWQ